MKTIFIALYRSFTKRYILYSDILRLLKSNPDYRFVILLPADQIPFYREKFRGDNRIIIDDFQYDSCMEFWKRNRLSIFFILVRKFLSGTSAELKNTTADILRGHLHLQWETTFFSVLYERSIRVCVFLGRMSPLMRRFLLWIETKLFPGNFYAPLFEKYRPDLLITSSVGFGADLYVMRAASARGVPVLSIVHSWDNPSVKGYRGGNPDHVIVWNEKMRDEIRLFHDVPEKKIFIGGIAHWDIYFKTPQPFQGREEFFRKHGLDAGRKLIFFGLSSPRIFRESFSVINDLCLAAEQNLFIQKVQFLVRLHPVYLSRLNNPADREGIVFRKRMEEITEKFSGMIKFNIPGMPQAGNDLDMPMDDMISFAEMLKYSDLMLNEYSTLMIEAAIFDLPVINVGLHTYKNTGDPVSILEDFTHIRRILSTGAVKSAFSLEEVIRYSNEYLADRTLDRDKRKKLVDQEVSANRGCAGKCIADHIEKILKG